MRMKLAVMDSDARRELHRQPWITEEEAAGELASAGNPGSCPDSSLHFMQELESICLRGDQACSQMHHHALAQPQCS